MMKWLPLLGAVWLLLPGRTLAQQTGYASYYADKFHGRKTASGQPYHMDSLTAAHRTLPFGSYIRVSSLLDSTRSVVLRVTDRGPYAKGRVVDVSRAAAAQLDMLKRGVIRVRVEPLAPDEVAALRPAAPADSLPPLEPLPQPDSVLTDGFVIQLGAFEDEASAQSAAIAVQQASGLRPVLHRGTTAGGKTLFRVLVGPYRERLQADAVLLELSQRNFGGFVLPLQTLR